MINLSDSNMMVCNRNENCLDCEICPHQIAHECIPEECDKKCQSQDGVFGCTKEDAEETGDS